jgi:putative tryptophan/tyrosine transport system substrate-binding protein
LTRCIGRRKFLATLGGVAARGPRAATGPRAADWYTCAPALDDADAQSRNAAFLQGLQELGWAVGRNVRIDYRWSASNFDPERMRKGAVELVALSPDVVLATTTNLLGQHLRPPRRAKLATKPEPMGSATPANTGPTPLSSPFM